MELTKATAETLAFSLAHTPERLQKSPLSPIVHEEMARGLRHVGDEGWRHHCHQAIELLTDDLAHAQNPVNLLSVAQYFQWAGEPERARPHLETMIARQETQMNRRPGMRVDFSYFVALVLLGDLDRVLDVGKSRGEGDYIANLVGLIESDRAGDRRTRDSHARFFTQAGTDLNQRHWYTALSAQMTARRFGRPTTLPTHPPHPQAVSDHRQYVEAFGEDGVATQMRAAQAGFEVTTGVLLEQAEHLEHLAGAAPIPPAYMVQTLAGLHRMAGSEERAAGLLEELLARPTTERPDRANALMHLGRDEELLSLRGEDHDGLHHAVVAYADAAQGDRVNGLADLRRLARKESPSAASLPVRVAEVLQLAVHRFSVEEEKPTD